MSVHPTEYGSDIGLERLSYQLKLISINIRVSPLLSREKVKHARRISEIAIIILSLKFIGSFEAAAFFFYYITCFSRLAALVCFLAVVPFVIFRILLQQLQEKNEQPKILSSHRA